MKTAQFTLGPWTVQDSTDNDDDTTLTIYAPKAEASIAIMDAFENGCECFSEIRANAHLIAAAPAMYAIIKDMREAFYVKGTRKALLEVMERSKNVLAQAEGRHPRKEEIW